MPGRQVQPSGTFVPEESDGHGTALHVPLKYGATAVAMICPSNPALHWHPSGTEVPAED
eukprot:CAMPEP_0181496624 /NCGR_PEP_ID=MMETSP1110-20121109/53082_1 /TAXON_ID=174948 /ORGANISM="Symbiodinium sp., Strain CCMP421" /LENGTH=58 /DNA_ID=CAMNT_0023624471 /DNA_START=931 /DNA_END=1107 /DNA_ORIENTATION=+